MKTTRLLFAVLSLSAAVSVRAETPAETFRQGESALAKGEFAIALQSYAAAARADRANQEYLQHYAMTRQIVELRNRLETEKNTQRWEHAARALRAFYVSEGIYPELLKLDISLHERLSTPDSAALLAETQLAMDKNDDAVATLTKLKGAVTPATEAFRGIALARSGKMDDAKKIAAGLTLPAEAGPSLLYTAARLQAITGDRPAALALLTKCFEATLPSLLEGFKSHALQCSEFAALSSSPEFARVLATASKAPESKCSGGSSCAGCPMSGKCPGSQGKQ